MIGPDSVIAARPGLAQVEVDGEVVLYDDSERRLHRLNAPAATLWRCLDGEGSLSDIAADIAGVYEQDSEAVLAQIVDIARQLADEGLVEV